MTLALSAVAAIGGSAAPVAPVKEAQAQVNGIEQQYRFVFTFCAFTCKGVGYKCCGPSLV